MKRKNLFNLLAVLAFAAIAFVGCDEKDDVAVKSVSFDKENYEVKVMDSTLVAYSVSPADASDKKVTFSVIDATIASVNKDGYVKGIKIGETKVIVKTNDGGFADTTLIAVTPRTSVGNSTIKGIISTNRTLYSDTTYILDGWVYLKENSGAVLTIQPGTVIKGKTDTKAALIVERGTKIMAEGTSKYPIVFTSEKAKGSRAKGDWGGIIICGKAKINVTGGEATIEGGVGSKYGGSADNDNSGILKYVRIEYPGYAFEADKEINGLTMGGVGSGTVIDYVQVTYSNDDAYEWFGGTVNCSHLIAVGTYDDDFDTDYGFSGTVQYAVALRDTTLADKSKSEAFESDNDGAGSSNIPVTNPKFVNVSLFGPQVTLTNKFNANYLGAMHIRRNSNLEVYNTLVCGWNVGLKATDSKGNAGAGYKSAGIIVAGVVKTYADSISQVKGLSLVSTLTNASDAKITDPFKLTAPNFLPAAGSPVLTGAKDVPASAKKESFIGAFGTEDWTAGWAEFDAQNKAY